ncbi:A-kinase anchor protein 13-like isoform X2 [Gigantopelta aegis]|uniref:A-kinase anchor protein 13-like isoform X2 n=1 Tax=Gigantopelta aegis TaxID=1735272 RepID=UPI001B88D631|nr:A-kinase anchor protein 13-like isoform X2 [Gigantopelta aegis]
MVETEGCHMTLSPVEAPVYGGITIVIGFDEQTEFVEDGELFLVFSGRNQRHIVSAKRVNKHTLHAFVPGHDIAEDVKLSVFQMHDESFELLQTTDFHYHVDTAYHMAQFLLDSVYNSHALDNLELIRTDQFDLANEILSTLDVRLSLALRHIPLHPAWHLLGWDAHEEDCQGRETLLHFTARLGLNRVASYILDKPGGQECCHVTNRNGDLPSEVASHNGFHELAERLAGYNTHGMVTNSDKQVVRGNGILRKNAAGIVTLTRLLNIAPQTTVEEDIEMLQEGAVIMKRCTNSGGQRPFDSDWPLNRAPQPQDTGMSCTMEVEDTIDRIFETCQTNHQCIESLTGVPVYGRLHGDSDRTNSNPSLDIDGSNPDIPDQLVDGNRWEIMEASLSTVRAINSGVLQHRDVQLARLLIQDVRRDNLARCSTSCPALDIQGRGSPLSPIDEADHHKSMLDLAEGETTEPHEERAGFAGKSYVHNSTGHDPDILSEYNIRICVNGVTVDSSTDYQDDALGQCGHHDYQHRCGSWCAHDVNHVHKLQQMARARVLALTGKSLSLNSLEGSDEGEYQDPQWSPSKSGRSLSMGTDTRADFRQGSISPTYYDTTTPPGLPTVSDRDHMTRTMSEPTTASTARSLTDIPAETKNAQQDAKGRCVAGRTDGMCSYEEEEYQGLNVPHSSMTKSLSTPSIPAATDAVKHSESQKFSRNHEGRKDSKHAQFQRQHEVEEEEDEHVAVATSFNTSRHKEISLRDFLTESNSLESSDDQRSTKGSRKDEERKKRKPSVFSRFQSSYRTKKNKEKDGKAKSTHHFVSVSISNSILCDVCHKPLTNKPALCCEDCLMNVHEHGCKDQISICEKSQRRVLPREASSMSALRDQSAPPVSGSNLRPSHSFKDKRSSSAPIKPQNQQSAVPPFLPHRNSLPTPSLYGSPPTPTSFMQFGQIPGRFNIEAINEECEVDSVDSGDIGQSNIEKTISESLESLDVASAPQEASIFEDEPDLMLDVDEPETWSSTVDRKILKKMSTKEIKRQDTIWELIQTEKKYCKSLKIMQKMFCQGVLDELQYTEEQVDRLFPRLDDLIEIHTSFLRQLLQLQQHNAERSIEEIGKHLFNQFSGENVTAMMSAYGEFCSHHKEAVQLYKDYLKADRKFASFIKSCMKSRICKKREIPDFILGVTLRLGKYPILIEAICKSTKDKKDREFLNCALHASKEVLSEVDHQVECYENLMEIQSKIDSRATTVFKGKKFKRTDLTANYRKLIFADMISWKNARGRKADVLAVILTDLILFVKDDNQKYSFFIQDGKSCVVPLFKLLVREKRDTRDSHGIYLISQNRQHPEMYELVCGAKENKERWMKILQKAVENCPEEDEEGPTENEVERRRQEERAAKAKLIIDQLHEKDHYIRQCCEEKNRLMLDLLDLYRTPQEANSRPNSQHEEVIGSESLEVLQAAMHEASHLATILQGTGTHLSRSVSSAGEHVSSSYVAMPIPKRAETFAGFDSSHEVPKGVLKKRYLPQQLEDGQSGSQLSLDRPDHDLQYSPISEIDDTQALQMEQSNWNPSSVTVIPPQSSVPRSRLQAWGDESERNSDKESMGDLSASSVSSLVPSIPPNQEQMMSIAQLVKYLHSLMNLTAQQGTAVESLRAQLAEANEKINKLSAEMSERKTGYRHNQLEELRNLQENISRDKSDWERQKLQERHLLEQEREDLEARKLALEQQEVEIQAKKDELKRQREVLQRQIDMLKETQNLPLTDPLAKSLPFQPNPAAGEPYDSPDSRRQPPRTAPPEVSHRRSASADFYKTDADVFPQHQRDGSQPLDLSSSLKQQRPSVSNLHAFNAPNNKQNLPIHLLSARNEQKVGGNKVQQLPMKLAGPPPPGPSQQSQYPSGRLMPSSASTPSPQGGPGRLGGGRRPSPSQSASVPSSLSQLMKLAEPSGKKKGSSPQAPQLGSSNTAPGAPAGHKQGRSDDIIYF